MKNIRSNRSVSGTFRVLAILALSAFINVASAGKIQSVGTITFAGKGSLESSETVWRFVPTRAWRAGSYAVVTHPDLEDPAGNRSCGPFEVRAASAVGDERGTIRPFETFATR